MKEHKHERMVLALLEPKHKKPLCLFKTKGTLPCLPPSRKGGMGFPGLRCSGCMERRGRGKQRALSIKGTTNFNPGGAVIGGLCFPLHGRVTENRTSKDRNGTSSCNPGNCILESPAARYPRPQALGAEAPVCARSLSTEGYQLNAWSLMRRLRATAPETTSLWQASMQFPHGPRWRPE